MDKPNAFRRKYFWTDETKIEIFGHNKIRGMFWNKGKVLKPKNTVPGVEHCGSSIMLWKCFGASSTGTLQRR